MRAIYVFFLIGLAGCSGLATTADSAKLYGSMSESDVALAAAAMQVALETKAPNETVDWANAENGNRGSIRPLATFITDRGVFCRAYDERLSIDGRDETVRNTACRSDDGRWIWTS